MYELLKKIVNIRINKLEKMCLLYTTIKKIFADLIGKVIMVLR